MSMLLKPQSMTGILSHKMLITFSRIKYFGSNTFRLHYIVQYHIGIFIEEVRPLNVPMCNFNLQWIDSIKTTLIRTGKIYWVPHIVGAI